MSKCFSVDENMDLYIGKDGNLAISLNLFSVMQACQHAAQAQLGEMVLAIDQGVPNFQTIWQDTTNVAQFEAYVRSAILSVPGVTGIDEFTVVVADNILSYSATIVTIYGREVLNA